MLMSYLQVNEDNFLFHFGKDIDRVGIFF